MKRCLFPAIFVMAMLFATIARSQPPGPPHRPSPEERLKFVSEKIEKEITLTTAQKEKIKMAYKEFFTTMDELRKKEKPIASAPPPPPPLKKEDMDRIVTQRDEKIKGVLNAAQFKKYQELEKGMRPPRPEGAPPVK